MSEPQFPLASPSSAPSPQPDQILNQPPTAGDLTAELKQSKRSFSKITIGLAAAALLVAAFFGGVATHAALADDSQQPTAQGGRQFPGGIGQRPGGGGGGGPLRGTIGTIDHIDGTDIYVKTADGRTIKVSTSDSTEIRVSQEGSLADLKDGQTIAVQGDTGGDGTVSADTITQTPNRADG